MIDVPPGAVTWRCPQCPFQVRGPLDADLLAEVRRSHRKRHHAPIPG